jgi:hypothetical protein
MTGSWCPTVGVEESGGDWELPLWEAAGEDFGVQEQRVSIIITNNLFSVKITWCSVRRRGPILCLKEEKPENWTPL